MRIGLNAGLGRNATLNDFLAQFEKAEADGFATVWTASIIGFDALTLIALAGRVTKKIELGTAVMPTFPRHPTVMAQQSLTAQAASDNRVVLGIGLSHKIIIENRLGLDFSRPILHMREYLTVLNGLFTGQSTQFQGKLYHVQTQLTVKGAAAPQILVAALGPKMLKLVGTLASGTIVWMGGAKYLQSTAVPLVTQAAREAGRPAPRIVAGLPIVVTNKIEDARSTASRIYTNYGTLPSYRAILDIEGARDPADVCVIGNEAEVERQLKHFAEIGVTDFNASPFELPEDPGSRNRTYQFLAEEANRGVGA
jgi:5,10-methylenetetrahydromethanopterin reductase